MIAKKYQSLLGKLTPFIFSYKENLAFFDLDPMGKRISDNFCYDPTNTKSESFYKHLKRMDSLTFGDQGMSMEGWVYFDCSTMPGAIVGFGIQASELPEDLKSNFKNISESTFIPISMFIAIPMLGDRWFGHNLSSLGSHLGEEFKGLGLLTKAYGLQVLKIHEMFGATQWGSAAINIHSRLADMELITSVTGVHTHKNTLCYKSFYTREKIEKSLSTHKDNRVEDFLVKASESNKQAVIQDQLENGETLTIMGKPVYDDGEIYYKVRRGLTSKAPK
jgi:hypothetical protein